MENSQLTVTDLASIQSVIDAACSRGAFRASEMKHVGELYEKLSNFLTTLRAQEQEPPTPNEGEENA